MPLFIPAIPTVATLLWGLLISIIPFLIKYLFMAIGLGFVTYFGFSFLLNRATSYVTTNYDNIGGALLQILNMAGVGTGISIIFGSMTTALAIRSAAGALDTRRKAVWRKPSSFQFEA